MVSSPQPPNCPFLSFPWLLAPAGSRGCLRQRPSWGRQVSKWLVPLSTKSPEPRSTDVTWARAMCRQGWGFTLSGNPTPARRPCGPHLCTEVLSTLPNSLFYSVPDQQAVSRELSLRGRGTEMPEPGGGGGGELLSFYHECFSRGETHPPSCLLVAWKHTRVGKRIEKRLRKAKTLAALGTDSRTRGPRAGIQAGQTCPPTARDPALTAPPAKGQRPGHTGKVKSDPQVCRLGEGATRGH